VVRPFLRRLQAVHDRQGRLSQGVVALIVLLVLASAWTTERIGIHALFGAFLMGAIMPKGTRFVRHLSEKLEDFTVVFLLPIFFANAGLKAKIGLIDRPELWVDTGLIIAVACLGKFGGSTLAARACGLGWRESSAIGTLMNTRGLMELLILTIGRDLGVITDAVYTMMVLMALATTAMTTPVLSWVYPRRMFAAEAAADADAHRRYTVLIPVAHPRSGGPLLELADTISGPGDDDTKRRVIALHLRPPPDDHEALSAASEHPATAPEPPEERSLAPLLSIARERDIPVKPVTFVSRDIPGDIAVVAAERRADLVLMGFHNPVFSKGLLGGAVHQVLRAAPADVAVFIDRGFVAPRRVLVPYLGGPHDRLALDLAGRIGRHARAEVTVLHIVPPEHSTTAKALGARAACDKAFREPGHEHAVHFRTVTHESPVSAVLDAASGFDLVVVAVAEQWGLESQLFGLRAERIAAECPTSLLIVRKHLTDPAPRAAATPAPAPTAAAT
ncbi:MAG TPA: cation:proton antiporter, partial [Tepidisphaeraceae bacterium]|nr:cation:proton antiporter [Tepidisphaeraceae bacterium]